MTRDLFDVAKPMRDAALAEIMRCLAADQQVEGAPINPAIVEGHKLGTHLQALCVAFCAEHFKTFKAGFTTDPILDIFAIAIAQAAAHVAATTRPTMGGRPVSPTASGQIFLRKVSELYFQQLVHTEHGLEDFNISFARNDDGSIEVEAFDFNALMKKREA